MNERRQSKRATPQDHDEEPQEHDEERETCTIRYDYELPPGRIAYHPTPHRAESRLMILSPKTGEIIDGGAFHDFPKEIRESDILIFNDVRVFKARLWGRRRSGGKVEALLLAGRGGVVPALLRPLTRLRDGEEIDFGGFAARLKRRLPDGTALLDFGGAEVSEVAEKRGTVPLPPYIKREPIPEDEERYQTVYAARGEAAAAPTAGFHFTGEILEAIRSRGARTAFLTLNIGYGTFAPVHPGQKRLHKEWYSIPEETRRLVEEERARPDGARGRIIAVGTTVVRALESYAITGKTCGETDLYIKPGFRFRIVEALVTNFHLPNSSLLRLVHAFAGEKIFDAYRHAVKTGYRFYSYGDVMFIRERGRC